MGPTHFSAIPAKAGIQNFQYFNDTGIPVFTGLAASIRFSISLVDSSRIPEYQSAHKLRYPL
jgi:hypothetical protein